MIPDSAAASERLIGKLRELPPEKVAEVEDFLCEQVEDGSLTRAMATASEPAFAAVWNNDDAAYDAL